MFYTQERNLSGRIIMGALFIIIGTVLLLQKLDVISLEELLGIRSIWNAWPIIFVIIGLGKMIDAPTMKKIGEGVWWIFLGGWLYVSINHIYDLSFRETWPAIIIAFGINVLWESFARNSKVKAGRIQ
jgi:hypothetical protein